MGEPQDSQDACALGPRHQEYSWEQQWQLEEHFKMEPYPDREAYKVLAARLNLKEEQVETWFIQRMLEQELRPPRPDLRHSARLSMVPCAYHGSYCCYRQSWRSRLIPVNPAESSPSHEHRC